MAKEKKPEIDEEKIKELLKSDDLSKNQKETLEDAVRDSSAMSQEDFQKFLDSLQSKQKAPVISEPQEVAQTVSSPTRGWSPAPSGRDERKEEDPNKYDVGPSFDEEPKYISSPEQVTMRPKRFDPLSLGKENNPNIPRERDMFIQSEISQMGKDNKLYDAPPPERSEEIHQMGRKKPFEQEEVKYDPQLPSS